jgi:hypothetical protein
MAQHCASVGAGGGQLGVPARVQRAAAPPGAGQAHDGAPIWPQQARQVSGLTGGHSAWNTLAAPGEHGGRAPSLGGNRSPILWSDLEASMMSIS